MPESGTSRLMNTNIRRPTMIPVYGARRRSLMNTSNISISNADMTSSAQNAASTAPSLGTVVTKLTGGMLNVAPKASHTI
jgi:hypothetical protein